MGLNEVWHYIHNTKMCLYSRTSLYQKSPELRPLLAINRTLSSVPNATFVH